MIVLRKKARPSAALFHQQIQLTASQWSSGGCFGGSRYILLQDQSRRYPYPWKILISADGKAGMMQGWPWLRDQWGFLYKSCISVKMYFKKDKMVPRGKKRNMEETILLTLRAKQKEWQDMLPADFPEAHGSNRAGCPLQRVERTTL